MNAAGTAAGNGGTFSVGAGMHDITAFNLIVQNGSQTTLVPALAVTESGLGITGHPGNGNGAIAVITSVQQSQINTNNQFNTGFWEMPTPVVDEKVIPTPPTGPIGVTANGGLIYFSESLANLMGTIAPPLGQTNSFTVPVINDPTEIAQDGQNNVWFIEPAPNEVGFVNINGNSGTYQIPTANALTQPVDLTASVPGGGSAGISLGSDSNMWFTESNINSISVIGTNLSNARGNISAPVLLQLDAMDPQETAPVATSPVNVSAGPFIAFGSNPVNGTCFNFLTSNVTLGQAAITTIVAKVPFNGTGGINPITTVGPLSPVGIVLGPDNKLYVCEFFSNEIDQLSLPTPTTGSTVLNRFGIPPPASGLTTTTALPNGTAGSSNSGADSRPFAICVGPDGNMWFTCPNINCIAKITTAGAISTFAIPTAASVPQGICAGPSNDVYFVEQAGNKICRVTNLGSSPPTLTEVAIPTTAALAQSICLGPDGNIWFTEETGADQGVTPQIGKLTVSSQTITEFSAGITASSAPFGICAGPDGNVYFTETNAARIGQITPAGVVQEFVTTTGSFPREIITGADGNLWFACQQIDEVGALNPSLSPPQILTLPLQTAGPGNFGICTLPTSASFPHGAVLFTETNVDMIGVITLGQ